MRLEILGKNRVSDHMMLPQVDSFCSCVVQHLSLLAYLQAHRLIDASPV